MDATLTPVETITGSISEVASIDAELSEVETISAEITIPTYINVDVYDGEYEVTPTFTEQSLPTANKTLARNIAVKPIRVESVSNPEGGRTVYIGG